MTLTERAAYIKGLAEGLDLDPDRKEVKVLNAIIELLGDIAIELTDVEDDIISLGDEIDALSDDLEDLEDDYYDDEDEDDEDDEDDDDDFFEVACPHCKEKIFVDGGVLEEGKIQCPGCAEVLTLTVECDEECICGCEHEKE